MDEPVTSETVQTPVGVPALLVNGNSAVLTPEAALTSLLTERITEFTKD
jgi:hypothetical protein